VHQVVKKENFDAEELLVTDKGFYGHRMIQSPDIKSDKKKVLLDTSYNGLASSFVEPANAKANAAAW